MTKTQPRDRLKSALSAIGGVALGVVTLACGTGLPELRPRPWDKPSSSETHGRFVEHHYQRANGPKTIHFRMLEVDGSTIRIPGGHVEFTTYCKAAGIDAVGFTVRGVGDDAGIFVLQLHGDEQILERICDYGSVGSWKGAVFEPACHTGWDAKKRERVKI